MKKAKTIRTIKAQKTTEIALKIASGEMTLAQAGSQISPNSPFPAQLMYKRIKSKSAQESITNETAKSDYTAEQCIAELDEAYKIAKERNNTQSMIAAALGKAKVKGLLVEQVRDVTTIDRGKAREAATIALAELEVTSAGIRDAHANHITANNSVDTHIDTVADPGAYAEISEQGQSVETGAETQGSRVASLDSCAEIDAPRAAEG